MSKSARPESSAERVATTAFGLLAALEAEWEERVDRESEGCVLSNRRAWTS
jgi:hypothetical protein